ncbi:MAG: tetratricopeptide repeat protein, partial [Cyclobacteriaceae bacterium]
MIRVACILVMFVFVSCDSRETKVQRFLLKGNLALEQSDTDRALYYYQQALALDACFADALNNIGTLHYRAGDKAKAMESYTKALEC